jgi:hypothetical protein
MGWTGKEKSPGQKDISQQIGAILPYSQKQYANV